MELWFPALSSWLNNNYHCTQGKDQNMDRNERKEYKVSDKYKTNNLYLYSYERPHDNKKWAETILFHPCPFSVLVKYILLLTDLCLIFCPMYWVVALIQKSDVKKKKSRTGEGKDVCVCARRELDFELQGASAYKCFESMLLKQGINIVE